MSDGPYIPDMTREQLEEYREKLETAKTSVEDTEWAIEAVQDIGQFPYDVTSEADQAANAIYSITSALEHLIDEVDEALEAMCEFEEEYGAPTLRQVQELMGT